MLVRFYFPLIFLELLFHFIVSQDSSPPAFVHPSETQDLNCRMFMEQSIINNNGTNKNENLSEYRKNRIVYPDKEDWNSFRMDWFVAFKFPLK